MTHGGNLKLHRTLSLLLHRASCRFTKYHTTNKCTNCMSFILNNFFRTLFTAPTCFDSISLIMCSLMMISDLLSKHVGAVKSVLKKWFKINDIQLVHLLVVWYLVNTQNMFNFVYGAIIRWLLIFSDDELDKNLFLYFVKYGIWLVLQTK